MILLSLYFVLQIGCFTCLQQKVIIIMPMQDVYVQMVKTYEKGSAEEIAIISSFKKNRNHVRYSSNEWSSVWSDLAIEQTLSKNSKSESGISGGRFCNPESAQRVWVQTLDHYVID